jgi:hypothetical protein
MEKKLRANDHKGGWGGCSKNYLIKRLGDEAEELEVGLFNFYTAEAIIAECADVANFAMMIADNYRAALAARAEGAKP